MPPSFPPSRLILLPGLVFAPGHLRQCVDRSRKGPKGSLPSVTSRVQGPQPRRLLLLPSVPIHGSPLGLGIGLQDVLRTYTGTCLGRYLSTTHTIREYIAIKNTTGRLLLDDIAMGRERTHPLVTICFTWEEEEERIPFHLHNLKSPSCQWL
ncbi:uncharacterized protein LY79DRAFT_564837 [Colletotrichum navitas]|uniref:Uncharacterized protein n=1 Tax=Colletotrichum navitas TaxID=681940 RepID=A0AAD8PR75_9PEZI|nr:uncharacterized protein LY79DRAFT_564837 [Colletotrichum navitas]KAK1579130.1 hypothetical protein LY79DRAFT_564837 [Colletotrichum navitas]